MAENTKIEWAHHTFNPWMGCQKVSPACDHCYAEVNTAVRALGVQWGPGAERRRTSAANWHQPLKWNLQAARLGIRYRVFCASLADVFDNQVPEEWRADLFELIRITPNLDWLLLTKRPQNIMRMVHASGAIAGNGSRFLPDNVWLGTTAEDQDRADQNIPALLRTRSELGARVLFVSMEPLLGPVDLRHLNKDRETNEIDALKPGLWEDEVERWRNTSDTWEEDFLDWYGTSVADAHGPMHPRLDWVIAGGESGHVARPMHPDYPRSLRDQCQAAGVPFMFKQWGEWKPINQMEEAEHGCLYVSNVKAKPNEDQGTLDDIHGRRCTVDTTVIHHDGSTHSITEPMAFLQGTEAMMTFKIGKKAAGRLLDDRTWDEVPA